MNNSLVFNQSKVSERARIFVDSLERRRNPHIRDYGGLGERSGHIEDYTLYQEKRDLERYRSFMNSSAYDDVRDAEKRLNGKKLVRRKLRSIYTEEV